MHPPALQSDGLDELQQEVYPAASQPPFGVHLIVEGVLVLQVVGGMLLGQFPRVDSTPVHWKLKCPIAWLVVLYGGDPNGWLSANNNSGK